MVQFIEVTEVLTEDEDNPTYHKQLIRVDSIQRVRKSYERDCEEDGEDYGDDREEGCILVFDTSCDLYIRESYSCISSILEYSKLVIKTGRKPKE